MPHERHVKFITEQFHLITTTSLMYVVGITMMTREQWNKFRNAHTRRSDTSFHVRWSFINKKKIVSHTWLPGIKYYIGSRMSQYADALEFTLYKMMEPFHEILINTLCVLFSFRRTVLFVFIEHIRDWLSYTNWSTLKFISSYGAVQCCSNFCWLFGINGMDKLNLMRINNLPILAWFLLIHWV